MSEKTTRAINTEQNDYARPVAKKGSKQRSLHGGTKLKFPFDRLLVKPTPTKKSYS
jgi:hypothetical protein